MFVEKSRQTTSFETCCDTNLHSKKSEKFDTSSKNILPYFYGGVKGCRRFRYSIGPSPDETQDNLSQKENKDGISFIVVYFF